MRKLTTSEFIERAKKIHGDKYDYSKSEYVNAKTKVDITCELGHLFSINPDKHLSGRGCIVCGVKSRNKNKILSTDEFISKAINVHGYRYDYSKSEYKSYHKDVVIICKEHGEFSQRPSNHISGKKGCQECSGSKRITFTEFIKRSNATHGNEYRYFEETYPLNVLEKTNIECKSCGLVFSQGVRDHYLGSGCSCKSKFGFDKGENGFVYILKSVCGNFIKIGITGDINERIKQLRNSTPFDFYLYSKKESTGYNVALTERLLHKILESRRAFNDSFKFDGYTEWFKTCGWIDDNLLRDVMI